MHIYIIPKWPYCVKCGTWQSLLRKHWSPKNIQGIQGEKNKTQCA